MFFLMKCFFKKKNKTKFSTLSDTARYLPVHMHFYYYYYLRGVSGPAYAHHDYSPRPTGHPASSGAGKAPRG
jgi:hypothetical protein